jgi:phage terminase large subunit
MTPRINRATVVREAEALLSTEHQAAAAPRVVWAGLEETPEAFALRCRRLQSGGDYRVLAAVPYGWSVPAGVQRVAFPPKHFRLLHPDLKRRYRVASGGRGSAKSHSFATALILRLLARRRRLLCARELQTSLLESVHHLLEQKIDALNLAAYFVVTKTEITCPVNGSEVIFKGVSNNIAAIKSLEGVDLCWLEEAEVISARSFEVLVPTIRATDSEIWISLNPDQADAPAMGYCTSDRDELEYIHVTYEDNPFFTAELEAERAYLQRVDADAYAHVWLGKTRTHSDSQIFKGKYSIEAFEPDPEAFDNAVVLDRAALDHLSRLGRLRPEHVPCKLWSGPLLGADWGFSSDPSTLIRCWIKNRALYIEHEAYGLGVDMDRLPDLFDTVPESSKHEIRADCARPETISYMKRHGFPRIVGCLKWKNCVEDGVAFIRAFERVVIHPRCVHTISEFRLYSYKVERLTGTILPDIEDRHNHTIDALRYALQGAIKHRGKSTVRPFSSLFG